MRDASPGEISILFRPVGPKELDLIAKSDFREFPPRLEGQPFSILSKTKSTQSKLRAIGKQRTLL
jgi:hypothetical protein